MATRAFVPSVLLMLLLAPSAAAQRVCPRIEVSEPQLLEPPEPASRGKLFFGKYFRMDARWLVVGAYGDKNYKGAAYMFEDVDGQWTFRQKLVARERKAKAFFSLYNAISRNTVAVAAPYSRTYGNKSGSVEVFDYDGASWVSTQVLVAPKWAGHSGMSFGYGLGMQGNTIGVGARGADERDLDGNTLATRVGALFIYTRRGGAGSPFELQQTIYGPKSGQQFGDDVAITGLLPKTGEPKICVTAPRARPNQYGAGYVYSLQSGVWTLAGVLKPSEDQLDPDDGNQPHHFEGVAWWRNLLIGGGERGASDVGTNTGAAWVWEYRGNDQWSQGPGLFPTKKSRHGQRLDVHGLDAPGEPVAAFVGAWGERVGGLTKAGAGYYYVQCSDRSWSRGPRITATVPATDDQFANMVAMNSQFAAFGAPKRDSASDPEAVDRGAVFVYALKVIAPEPTSTPEPKAGGRDRGYWDDWWSGGGGRVDP